MKVVGSHGEFPNASAQLFLGNAGTAMQPLTASGITILLHRTKRGHALYGAEGLATICWTASRECEKGAIVGRVEVLTQTDSCELDSGADVSCSDPVCPPVTTRALSRGR